MPDWSLLGGGGRFESSPVGNNSESIRLTANAVANTKGIYREVIASTSMDAVGLEIFLNPRQTAAFLVDIAVGAVGSEQIILSNLMVGGSSLGTADRLIVPILVPSGSRLSARCQASTGSRTFWVNVVIYGKSFQSSAPLERMTTYGANTADSGGVAVDAGAVANTKGAYSEVVALASNEIKMLWMMVGTGDNAALSGGRFMFDIAVGAGGSEQIIIPDLPVTSVSGADSLLPFLSGPHPSRTPSGTRLAVRSQSNITNATDRIMDVAIYGGD